MEPVSISVGYFTMGNRLFGAGFYGYNQSDRSPCPGFRSLTWKFIVRTLLILCGTPYICMLQALHNVLIIQIWLSKQQTNYCLITIDYVQ